jgi:hypothetical protein
VWVEVDVEKKNHVAGIFLFFLILEERSLETKKRKQIEIEIR